MKNLNLVLLIVFGLIILSFQNNRDKLLLNSDDEYVQLSRDTFDFVINRYETSALTYCEFYQLFTLIRLDTFLLLDTYYDIGCSDRYWFYIGTIQDITGISNNMTLSFAGGKYYQDSVFYNDLYNWGIALHCIDSNVIDHDSFQNYMHQNDLFHDSTFVENVLPKKTKNH